MEELEQGWLSIELEAIEEELDDWSEGLKETLVTILATAENNR